MSFDLTNLKKKGELSVSTSFWTLCLVMAEDYGWRPIKTLPPDGIPPGSAWPGNYDSNEGQKVTSKDANALANSLEAAANDPALGEKATTVSAQIQAHIEKQLGKPLGRQWGGPIAASDLRPVIDFLKKGEFRID